MPRTTKNTRYSRNVLRAIHANPGLQHWLHGELDKLLQAAMVDLESQFALAWKEQPPDVIGDPGEPDAEPDIWPEEAPRAPRLANDVDPGPGYKIPPMPVEHHGGDGPLHTWTVAGLNGEAAGNLGAEERDGLLVVRNVMVEREHRGQGIATAMYRAAIEYARAHGLGFGSDNRSVSPEAQRIWASLRRQGYVVEGPPIDLTRGLSSTEPGRQPVFKISAEEVEAGPVNLGAALADLSRQSGVVSIADLQERLGVPLEQVHEILREHARAGNITLTRNTSNEPSQRRVNAAGMEVPGLGHAVAIVVKKPEVFPAGPTVAEILQRGGHAPLNASEQRVADLYREDYDAQWVAEYMLQQRAEREREQARREATVREYDEWNKRQAEAAKQRAKGEGKEGHANPETKVTIEFGRSKFGGPQFYAQLPDGTVASLDVRIDRKEQLLKVELSQVPIKYQGQGIGRQLYAAAIDYARSNGLGFSSDASVSPQAQRLWEDSFPRLGYKVERDPRSRLAKSNEYYGGPGTRYNRSEKPVYRISAAELSKGPKRSSPVERTEDILAKWGKDWTDRMEALSTDLAQKFTNKSFRLTEQAMKTAFRDAGLTVRFQTTKAAREAYKAVIADQTGLIRNMSAKFYADVQQNVWQSVMRGGDLNTLSQSLQETYGINSRRAALIARDQNAKAKAVIERTRRAELGLKKAIWQHSSAGKVPRPAHVKLSGTEFDVVKGAWDPHEKKWIQPGELINCRCTSRAIIPGFDEIDREFAAT